MNRKLAIIGVVGVLIIGPVPAQAVQEWWPRATCASGAIDYAGLSPAPQIEESTLRIEAHLGCVLSTRSKPSYYGFALYTPSQPPQGELSPNNMYEYARRPAQRTSFAATKRLPQLHDFHRIAICLVTDTDVRLGCVEISRDPASVTPLPIDDPLVAGPVVEAASIGPECGTCW